MRITHIAVRNYRCLESLDLEIADYTALVGANGAGKSSVLYALDWFFHGFDLHESDLTHRDGVAAASQVQVTVTFGDLSSRDRYLLGEYGRGDVTRFRRSWTLGQKGTKVVGRALQGPGFSQVRQANGIGAMRSGYRALSVEGLPGLVGNVPKDDILATLTEWENRPENQGLLVEVNDVDANHMFGINGTNVIRECIRLVLVPAATDMQSQLANANKGSALSELIGAVISDAGARARDDWLAEHEADVRELNTRVTSGIMTSVTAQAERINEKLKDMVPDASVQFVPEVPEWVPKGDASITTSVTIDGSTNDIARQGHGVQRAVMIALFQSLVPEDTGSEHDAGMTTEVGQAKSGPALIVCIEEPEIYQHPIRARSFARVLAALSDQPRAQVMIATHSPYFVSPSQFESIRRFRMGDGTTIPSIASIQEVVGHGEADEDAVRKIVQKRLPTTFSEGFFADAVVLVEGDTDRVVLECLADRLGTSLDERGISLLELGGKSGLRIPHAIFASLGIPTYVIADGDADGASRVTKGSTSNDVEKNRANAEKSNKAGTERLVSWLPDATATRGSMPYVYGRPTVVTDRFTVWRDDLESELAFWPSFLAALDAAGGRLRQKNALTYRAAVQEAHIDDLPDSLRDAVAALVHFGGAAG